MRSIEGEPRGLGPSTSIFTQRFGGACIVWRRAASRCQVGVRLVKKLLDRRDRFCQRC